MRFSCFAAALFAFAGCGGPAPKPFHYPLDNVLRFDDVQVKGTHNSYHIEMPGTDVPEWDYTMAPLDVQLDQQGVRQLELDLNWIKDDDGLHHHFEVYHEVLADEDTTCRLFVDCLKTIKGWSDRYPGHLPIYIQMEAKSNFELDLADEFFADFEGAILSVFPRSRIITPDEIRGDAATLPAALGAAGWPTLDGLRGRVIFNFDNRSDTRMAYTYGLTSLAGRLAFVDSDPTDPFGAITIQNDPTVMLDAIHAAVAAHLLVRTLADNEGVQAQTDDMSMFQAALASEANFLSTDFPAPVPGLAYYVDITDGTPARCNPASPRPECTSLALEDPAFVGSGAK